MIQERSGYDVKKIIFGILFILVAAFLFYNYVFIPIALIYRVDHLIFLLSTIVLSIISMIILIVNSKKKFEENANFDFFDTKETDSDKMAMKNINSSDVIKSIESSFKEIEYQLNSGNIGQAEQSYHHLTDMIKHVSEDKKQEIIEKFNSIKRKIDEKKR